MVSAEASAAVAAAVEMVLAMADAMVATVGVMAAVGVMVEEVD